MHRTWHGSFAPPRDSPAAVAAQRWQRTAPTLGELTSRRPVTRGPMFAGPRPEPGLGLAPRPVPLDSLVPRLALAPPAPPPTPIVDPPPMETAEQAIAVPRVVRTLLGW
jgi:hypothetical protein